MTALSTTTHCPGNHLGATSTPDAAALSALLCLQSSHCYWRPVNALSRAKACGFLDTIPAAADAAAERLQPVSHKALTDRLTLLGMTMLHGKGDDEKTAWLHETARLLADWPQEVLFKAIDDCLKEPGRVFAPTVGEIIEKGAEALHGAELEAARLRELANLIVEGVSIPDYEPPASPQWMSEAKPPEPYCTPDEAREILAEFGLRGSSTGDALEAVVAAASDLAKRPKPKTRAEYIAEGKVPPRLTTNPDGIRV